MKIKCVLIDDEPFARNLLEDDLSSFKNIELLAQFSSPIQAQDFLKEQAVDLLFLDIQMPGMLGTQFLRTLENPPLVIFTTAYDNYAIEGFELNAVDYLLKPIRKERLQAAIQKAEELLTLRSKVLQKEIDDHIIVHVEYQKTKILYEEISYIEGLKDYVKIYLTNREFPLLTRSNLRGMEKKLPDAHFTRIHNSFIVNNSKISHISLSKVVIKDTELPVGKKYIAKIRTFHDL